MDRHCKYCYQCAFVLLFLAVAHVQALDRAHMRSRGYDHGASKGSSLTLHWSPWEKPTSLTEEVQLGGAAVVSRRTNVMTNARGFNLGHPVKDPHPSYDGQAAENSKRSHRQEVEALTSFRAGISGGDMTIFRSWNANDSTPCGWKGISCSLDKQHVTALNLHSHQLVGRINSALLALGKLQFLERLDLSDNKFSSFISGATLVNFSSLAFLNMSDNQVTGDIPHQIGELPNLHSLIFNNNNMTGPIPSSLGNCTLLNRLELHSNLLRGGVPQMIGRLVHLQVLDLGSDTSSRNSLSGSVPSSLGNCSSLSSLILDSNGELGGQIPRELSQLQGLKMFSLYACNFKGVLPRWLGNLTNLGVVDVSQNHFEGPIPAEFGRLRNLSFLFLGENNLTGDIPPDIGNCTALTIFQTDSNSLTGVIPSGLGDCVLLKYLVLGPNPLMAPEPIPSWINSSLTQLQEIYLPDMNLRGEIPTDLGRLPRLQVLQLFHNNLSGSIPSSLSNCTSLQNVSFSENNLKGHIPSEIGLLSNLYCFEISNNFLTGSMPISITNLTQLVRLVVSNNFLGGAIDGQWDLMSQVREIDLGYNFFVGTIPRTLSNCSNLYGVYFNDNHLTGEIPASFGNLSRLGWLDLSENSISGKLPIELARCSHLVTLDLNANKLKGPIPQVLGSLLFMEYLDLSHNEFTGTIAGSLGKMMGLISLDLSYNRFTGNVPVGIVSNIPVLSFIDISHNFLSGSLSVGWSYLEEIQVIDISANNLSGSISNLGNLSSLQWLDVSLNNFSGGIPESLAALPGLMFFNASYNNFAGPLPTSGAFKSNITADSFLGNPGLCAVILGPSRECRDNASHSSENCKHFQCARKWIPISVVGVIRILVAIAVVMWLLISRGAKNATKVKEVFDIVVNFGPNRLKFGPTDILAVIEEGENIIGTSPGSVVYKGSLPGYDMIAIKTFIGQRDGRMDGRVPDLRRSLLEQEANIQAKLRHRNVLKVLSFCSNLDFRALLLEYMPQGSLHDHLYPGSRGGQLLQERGGEFEKVLQRNCELPWERRFAIAIDVAEGMTYLHHDCVEPLIHGDLKPSNIVLDDEMVAKVADFGISKLVNPRRGEPAEATVSSICGTVGYMPPEYAFVATVSTKGDVFSYGVLLLEMLSGRPPTDTDIPLEASYRDSNLEHFQVSPIELLDPILQQEGRTDALKYKQMMLLAKIAFFCTRQSPESRPSMKDVRLMLIQIKDLGVEATIRRTLSELAHETEESVARCDVDVWENENPNDVALPSISS